MNPLACLTLAKHGCLCFSPSGGPVLYIDPFQLSDGLPKADLVIVTHPHSDHYSPEDLQRIAKEDTEFVSTQPVLDALHHELGVAPKRLHLLSDQAAPLTLCGVELRALPAENKNHPLGFGFGVLFPLNGCRYYVAGDTDQLADTACDVLFVPCDGIYNMPNFETAVPAQLARFSHRPQLVVPYHYAGYIEGTDQNGPRLAAALEAAGFSAQLVISPNNRR